MTPSDGSSGDKPVVGDISRVAVVGAGLMGGGIAAHLANAGAEVLLLDIVPPDLPEGASRSTLAEEAVARLLRSDPAAFMHRRNARLITPGNLDDHLHLLAQVDWIIEAVVERLEIKHADLCAYRCRAAPGFGGEFEHVDHPAGATAGGRL